MYDFYIDRMRLPLAPGKLTLKVNNANKAIDLINLGEVNLLKSPKLSEISFEFRLIARDMYQQGSVSAADFLSKLENLKLNKEPFRFIVVRQGDAGFDHDTNMMVSLEDYTVLEDAAEGSDIFVTINLKQYKNFGVIKINTLENVKPPSSPKYQPKVALQTKKATTPKKSARPSNPASKTTTVKPMESFYEKIKKAHGTTREYRKIMAQNKQNNPFSWSAQELQIGIPRQGNGGGSR